MRIRHQSFRGHCLFCGFSTPAPVLPLTGSAPSPRPDPLPINPGERQFMLAAVAAAGGTARAAERVMETGGIGIAATKAEPEGPRAVIEDDFDDCPRARMAVFRFLAFFLLPLLFWVFGWEALLLGVALGGLLFRFVLNQEEEQWFGLREVQGEHDRLMALVSSANRNLYQILLGPAIHSLFTLRDRAFRTRSLTQGESLEEIDFKIRIIQAKAQAAGNTELGGIYSRQLEDLLENRRKMERLAVLLERFEASKNGVVESIRLLRNRILLAEARGDGAEETKILQEMKSLHDVHKRVFHSHGKILSPKFPVIAPEPAEEQPYAVFPRINPVREG